MKKNEEVLFVLMWKNLQDILSSERKEKTKTKQNLVLNNVYHILTLEFFFNEINKNDIHICLYVHQETLKEYIRNFKNKGALGPPWWSSG